MRSSNLFSRRITKAICEIVEARQLLSTVSGTVFNDLNRNGRLDSGEAGVGGRTVFADYDYNGVVNGSDPIAITDANGKYTLTTRASQVSARVVTRPGETTSLPYGASSIWLPTVNGTVSAKNIGIAMLSTVSVQFDFFADHDGDGVRDSGEPRGLGAPSGFGGWIDLDGNDTQNLAAGETSIYRDTSTGGEEFFYADVLPGTRVFQIRANEASFSSGQSITVNVPPGGGVVEVGILSDVVPVDISLFNDANGNGTWDHAAGENQFSEFDVFAQTHAIFLDRNSDGVRQSNEPTVWSSHYFGNQPDVLSPGTYTIVGLQSGERLTRSATFVVGANGGTFSFGVADARDQRVDGRVFSDTNRNGRLDASESKLSGRTVFADYNYNGRFDANEPSAVSDSSGSYSLTTRRSNVSVRLVLNTGETNSLPYGATSIWLAAINGVVTGKNLGIASSAPATTTVVGYVYLDVNKNGRRDPGELPPADVGISALLNGQPIAGTLSQSTGQYVFSGVPIGATLQLSVGSTVGDTVEPYLLVEPYFTTPIRTVVAQTSPQTVGGNFGLTLSHNVIVSTSFTDLDQNQNRDLYDRDVDLLMVWLDVNQNRLRDADEPFFLGSPTIANQNYRGYLYLNVPAGSWQVAMRRADDNDLYADEVKTVTFADTDESKRADFIFQPTAPVISGSVFSDDNGNGVQDGSEGGLSTYRSFKIFVDYNDNHYQDVNEPSVESEFDGRFYFESDRAGTVYVDMSASLKVQTFPTPLTMGQRFDPATGMISGLHFGYRDQLTGWVNGSTFIDVNHNGKRDASDLDAAGRLVYADYNYNGQFDAGEPSAYSNQNGSYHLATRGTNVSIRLALPPGEIISLPSGATSLWIPTVGDFVFGKNLGLFFTPHE